MTFTLAISPCPNDTFIFDALVNKKIDTNGLDFEVKFADVESLNNNAIHSTYDFTKISYGAYQEVYRNYILLNNGGAFGKGVGPLLLTNTDSFNCPVEEQNIAIPGKNTTANFLFSTAYPDAKHKIFLRYDQIEDFVLQGKGLGVIIHQNRFTYAAKGLHKIIDLGEFWENKTQCPIPLGGIVGKRNIGIELLRKVDQLIHQSISYGYTNYPQLSAFTIANSPDISEEIMRQYIALYVNEFSTSIGVNGKHAVMEMFKTQNGAIDDFQIFV
jgi:1,4-dihydroxy-6-naphthoate synthase